MDSKIEVLLGKTNIDKEHYQYFYDAKIIHFFNINTRHRKNIM